jgi:hypothetical protein
VQLNGGGEKAVYQDLKMSDGEATFVMVKSGKYW